MSQTGRWRATYTPGRWVVLSGPTSMVVLQPAPGKASTLVNALWDDVVASSSIDDLVQRLAAFNIERMPSFAAFFWDGAGLRSLVRGSVRVMDLSTGDYVADGTGIQTWSEVGLGDLRQVRIDMEPAADDALQLPLVVGAVSASAIVLDATDEAVVSTPQQPVGVEAAPAGGASAGAPADASLPQPEPAAADEPEDVDAEGEPVIVTDAAALASAGPREPAPAGPEPAAPAGAEAAPADAEEDGGGSPEPGRPSDEQPAVEQDAAPEPDERRHDGTHQPGPDRDDAPAGAQQAPSAPPEYAQQAAYGPPQQAQPQGQPDQDQQQGQQDAPPPYGRAPQGAPQDGQPHYGPPQQGGPQQDGPPQGRPQYGQPQYGQPQYGQPQGQPQYGQPQYGQPQYGQPQYGQPQYGQPQYSQQPQYGPPSGRPPGPPPGGPYGPPPGYVPAPGGPGPSGPPAYPGPGPIDRSPFSAPQQPQSQASAPMQSGAVPSPTAPPPPAYRSRQESQEDESQHEESQHEESQHEESQHDDPRQPERGDASPPQQSGPVTRPEDTADHDGATVFATSLARAHKVSDAGSSGGEGLVLADMCVVQHPNPPGSQRCRICGGSIPTQSPRLVTRPVLAVLRPSQGAAVEVDRPVLIGRSPTADRVAQDSLPRLMTVPSPSHDISRTHVRVTPQGWDLTVMDEYSTNGTILVRPGAEPERERLTPGEAVPVQPGQVLDLGDGITITIEPPS